MATSPLNLKASYHVRSISLPSRSHPLTLSVEEQLCQLRSSEATSCSSSTCNNLSDLNSLDVFLQIKDCVQDLQSTLRRKKDGIANEVGLYMIARKKVSKVIQKCLRELKKAENKNNNTSIVEKDQNLIAIINVLREVESITLSMFKSLLSSMSSSNLQTKTTGWSFVSKFIGKKSSQGIQVMNIEDIQKSLDSIQSSMQGLDGELECIYKNLIKTRVSLLNILSQ
ncbi:hypothetical protein AQUCO_01500390v1 [Aquilegia coerulea]|uniref:DUF241 domain-containing protein n=1 Tax=Aquilegia coerulea TaxID=218851 RepID=A0A2G5DTH9_AQUCA|nr:hypothetical protein AQUCO_01500390v1 [Aquilegia coerulea]